MKILHIDFDDLKSPLGGGQSRRTFEINRRLIKSGHQVTVVTSKYPGSKDEVIEGIKYLRVGKETFPHNFISFFRHLPRVVKAIPHDILVEDFTSPVSCGFTPLYTRKPVIASVQCFFAHQMSRKYFLPFFAVEDLGVKFVYKNFIVLAENAKRRILALNKKANVIVLPEGVEDIAFDKYSSKCKDPYILFLGRIDIHQKGIDLLLQAFAQIKDQIRLPLLIAGTGKDIDKMFKQIKKHQLQDWVKYVGRVSGKEKFILYNKAKFVCIPSRYETFGMVATEAGASKKAVIIFDTPAINTVVNQNCAMYVRPFDVKAYAQAMLRLANDEKLCEKMGLAGRKNSEKYRWDEIAKKQEEFYFEVLRCSKR